MVKNLALRILCVICFTLLLTSLIGQSRGILEYTFHMNFGDMVYMKPKSKSTLYFNNTESLFIYKKAPKLPGDKNQISERVYFADFFPGGVLMDRMYYDSLGFMVFYNFEKDSLIARERLDDTLYLVVDTLDRPQWTLIDSFKTIKGFECKKATTYFRGRNYFAWYSTEHPLPFGPWKLVGLPGLVFEVTTESRELGFTLKNIDFDAEPQVHKPQRLPRIGHGEFWHYYLNGRMKTIDRVIESREERLLPNGEYRFLFKIPQYHTSLEIMGNWNGELDQSLYKYPKH